FLLAIGGYDHSALRRKLVERYARGGARWATVVHGQARVSPTATLGEGVVILAGATINTGAVLSEHSVVNTGAIIEHDVRVGAFTQVGPAAVIGGGTIVA